MHLVHVVRALPTLDNVPLTVHMLCIDNLKPGAKYTALDFILRGMGNWSSYFALSPTFRPQLHRGSGGRETPEFLPPVS